MAKIGDSLRTAVAGLFRRPVAWAIWLIFAIVFFRADIVAGLFFLAITLSLRYLLRRRTEWSFRRGTIFLVVAFGLVAMIAALGVPSYRQTYDTLDIPAGSIREGGFTSQPGSFDFSYDLMTTSPDAQKKVDTQAKYLTSLGMDGYFLLPDGTLQATDNTTLLLHSHIADTRAMFLVQNFTSSYQGGDFNPALAHRILSSPTLSNRLVENINAIAVGQHWDGVILDFESLNDADWIRYAKLVGEVRHELPSAMQLGVDLPPILNKSGSGFAAASREIGLTANFVNLMTYDLHVSSGAPGPIAPLPWVRQAVSDELGYISPTKLKLGAADYADVWGPLARKTGAVLAPQAAFDYAKAHSLPITWDAQAGEWNVTTADGSTIWVDDYRAIQTRIGLAQELGLRGLNVWELSRAQNLSGLTAGIKIYRPYVSTLSNRRIDLVKAKGLVALTFDDGPDPTWTPKVLSVLEKHHVPATFFVIGNQAVANVGLVQREIGDGDVVGNHTYTHPDLASLPPWLARTQISAGSWVIKGITGLSPLLFRSPYGITDNLTLAKASSAQDLTHLMGLEEIGWNTDTRDWSRPGVQRIVYNALAAPNAEPVVLLHDGGGNRYQTLKALPKIIAAYRSKGYAFTTVDHIDGGVRFPYVIQRQTFLNVADSVLSVAVFKLTLAISEMATFLLALIALISIFRLTGGWLLAAIYLRSVAGKQVKDRSKKISILVPAHNEEKTIVKTLASLAGVSWPNLEIVVAENGSTDNTLETAIAFAKNHPQVKVLKCKARGKAGALNEALAYSTGEVIVVLDADTVISENFCEAVMTHFEDPRVGAVAGNVQVGNRRNLLTRLQALEYLISLSLDRASQAQLGIVSVVPGAAGAFRREAVLQAGGWQDRTLVEDTDLTIELHRRGWKIAYEARAKSLTESPETLGEVFMQRSRWIYGTTQAVATHQGALFATKEGRLGLFGLPWLTVTQVVLPVFGPLVDLWLLIQIGLGQSLVAIGALFISFVLELSVAIWAVRRSVEKTSLALGVFGLRFIWRPLMLWIALQSTFKFVRGKSVLWKKIRRKNTVDASSMSGA